MEVLIGNFDDVEYLTDKGYVCIGGEYRSKKNINKVVGLSHYALRYDLRAKDYEATTIAFNHQLVEKIRVR